MYATALSWLLSFSCFLHFIRSNIIDYIIKRRTYIIKISEHFTGHLIKLSGAVPKEINLHETSSMCYCAFPHWSWVLFPGKGASSFRTELYRSSESEGLLCRFSASPNKETQKAVSTNILSPHSLQSVKTSVGVCLQHAGSRETKGGFHLSSLILNCCSSRKRKQMLFRRQQRCLVTTANFHQAQGA